MSSFSLPTSRSLTPRSLDRAPSHDDLDLPTIASPLPNEKSTSRFAIPPVSRTTRSRIYHWRRQILIILTLIITIIVWFVPPPFFGPQRVRLQGFVSPGMTNLPGVSTGPRNGPDPDQWLQDYSGDVHTVQKGGMLARTNKPKAALISLVRNQELEGIVQSMTQLEYHWNHKYQYPWIFFNDEPFTEEFKVEDIQA